jgi:hypothetical protein
MRKNERDGGRLRPPCGMEEEQRASSGISSHQVAVRLAGYLCKQGIVDGLVWWAAYFCPCPHEWCLSIGLHY